ncbi:tyrosine-type recombinase/integrase [Bacteroides ovatus]|uniref:tyrosine-type recombinase/integrase n=1 Tax=Bacteroides ovatus TaxID=28116 RepID=UPI00359C12A4
MAKAIKIPRQPKVKEPVRIRYKALSDGSQSVYLDIYRDGKRQYEFLKLYLIPETSTTAKAQNKATLAAVNTIKSQRIIELTNNAAGLKNTSRRSKMLLLDWMQTYKESQEKKSVRGSGKLIGNTINILRAFNEKAAMRDINRDFCLALIDYMRNVYVSANGKKLSQFSCVSYFGCFRGALNAAVREDIIGENPVNKLNTDEKIRMPESKREFLTIDEVKTLIGTPCRREDIKSAFLFSCYCGLRISDVLALKWKNVDCTGEQWRINIIMQKTRQPLYLPLSMQARKWMPERDGATEDDPVFATLPCEDTCNVQIKPWVKEAGITKHVTYHVSRHTFATMMLTLGADLYTVCKLLGHTDVKTTQIYAKIINKKKDDAIGLIDTEFANT